MGFLNPRRVRLAALLPLLGLTACFSELKGDACASDLECFPNETCLAGSCVERAVESPDVGMDAEPDAEEPDAAEEPDTSGSGLTGEARLEGCVYDRMSGAPVTVARIYTEPNSGSAVTGSDGCYTIVIPRIERFDNFFEIKLDHFEYILKNPVTVTVSSNITNVADILACKANGCGNGCAALPQAPGDTCEAQPGCAGEWTCAADGESLSCAPLAPPCE